MLTLISKIFFCMLFAATLGWLLGWYLRQRSAREQIKQARVSSLNSLGEERAKVVSANDRSRQLLGELEELRTNASRSQAAAEQSRVELNHRHEKEMRDRIESLNTGHQEELSQLRQSLELKIARAQEVSLASASNTELERAKLDLQNMGARLVDMDRRFTARNIEMDDLVGRLNAAQTELATLKLSTSSAATFGSQAEQQRTHANLQVADLQRRLQDVELASQQKVELQGHQHTQALDAAMAQVHQRAIEVERLQGELNDVRGEFAALRLHTEQKEQIADRYSNETDRLNAMLVAAQTELGDREARLSQTQMQVANQDFELATLRNENKVKDAQLTELSASIQAGVYELDRVRSELMRRDQRLHERQEIVVQYEREIASLMAQRDRMQEQLDDKPPVGASERELELQASLEAAQTRVFEADAALQQYQESSHSHDLKLERYHAQILKHEALMADKETELVQLRADLQSQVEQGRVQAEAVALEAQRCADGWREATQAEQVARQELQDVRSEFFGMESQRNTLQIQLDELQSRVNTMSAQAQQDLTAAQLRYEEVEQRAEQSARLQADTFNAELGKLRAELAERPAQLARRTAAPVETKRKVVELPAWGADKPRDIDDLQLIWGIGPKLEALLHKLGIWTFRQIGSWTKRDINEVDARLESFHGRIQRDGWVASAKDEYAKKYGEKI